MQSFHRASSQVVFTSWPVVNMYEHYATSVTEYARELTVVQVGPGFGFLVLGYGTSKDLRQVWMILSAGFLEYTSPRFQQ